MYRAERLSTIDPVHVCGFLERILDRLTAAINAEAGIVNWKDCLAIVSEAEDFLRANDLARPDVRKIHDPADLMLRLGIPNMPLAKILLQLLNHTSGFCSKEDLARAAECGEKSIPVYLSRLRTFLVGLGLPEELKPVYKIGYRLSPFACHRIHSMLAAGTVREPAQDEGQDNQ